MPISTPSMRPNWAQKLATRLSGQAPGRIGSAAGALGSKGTPTSMRGRFAKYGSQYNDETGAQAALATTSQASNAVRSGAMAEHGRLNAGFDAQDYERKERLRRGLTRGAAPVAAAPVAKPAGEDFEPVMDQANRETEHQRMMPKARPVAPKPNPTVARTAPSFIQSRYGTGNPGAALNRPDIFPTTRARKTA